MKKSAQIANFNVVFGEDELPMLDCFDTIVIPALRAGIVKKKDENEFLFKDIDIYKNKNNYVLTGKIVKKTILEIKTDLNESGELVEKDEKHSAAPYSSFAINLLNHRMIFLPNQKGSPSLANFRTTIKYVFDRYIKSVNSDENEKKLEYAVVNIVGIPNLKSMKEVLTDVEKVNCLTLRFYPLNGDKDYTEAFGILSNNARKDLGCKTGSITFNSPTFFDGIKTILTQAAGTIKPILNVVTKDKRKAKLTDDELSVKYAMDIDDGEDIGSETQELVTATSQIEELIVTNEVHQEIYNRNEDKIRSISESR